tara:strand:- start:3779 stop:3994 length:216 start_codon:yes stop_codon:yes gene_type:complete
MQVETEHRVSNMPIEYFQIPEIQEKFDSLKIRSFDLLGITQYYYIATIILDEENNEKSIIISENFLDHVKD